MQFTKGLPKLAIELQQILLLFISSRLILTTIGVFSSSLIEPQYGKQFTWAKSPILNIWGVWDTFWYVDIAQNGYAVTGTNPANPEQLNLAFFPLYPMLMKVIGSAIGGKYFLAGVIISNFCLLLTSYFLYKLVLLEFNKKIALNSVKYLYLFPTAFILSGVFTESLYLLLLVLCFYAAKTQRWRSAGIIGFFLALTRLPGVLVILPLFYEYLKTKEFKLKQVKFDLLFLLLIPLGLFVYASYNYYLTGDFFTFTHTQAAWNRSLTDPVSAIVNGLRDGLFKPSLRRLIESIFAIVSLTLVLLFWRKIGVSYWLFSLYSILLPLLSGVISMPRLVLPIFPLYILFAQFSRNRSLDQSLTLALGLLQGFLMVFWSRGYSLIV